MVRPVSDESWASMLNVYRERFLVADVRRNDLGTVVSAVRSP